MSKRGENIYKRKDGRWEGRILIHAPDSKRISVYGKTYREVRDRMQEKKLLPGIVHCPKRVSEAAEVWLASKERLLKPSSVAKYRNLVQRHILPLLGMLRICDLDRNTVSGFVRALSCGQTGSGVQLTRKTVRDVLMILEKSVRFAGELSFSVEKNELSGKTGGGKRITVLSEQEQKGWRSSFSRIPTKKSWGFCFASMPDCASERSAPCAGNTSTCAKKRSPSTSQCSACRSRVPERGNGQG